MGFAIAQAARDRGARVTLIVGATSASPPHGVEIVAAPTARAMHDAVLQAVADADALIMAAAVADYEAAAPAAHKLKKGDARLILELVPTPDILAAVAARRAAGALPEHLLVVGFAAEDGDVVAHARDKLRRKRLDLIVANDISAAGSGFGTDTNQVWFLDRSGAEEALPLLPKLAVAHALWDRVRALRGQEVRAG
jgi:phosphopantothenoylcysteine decarboxylase/phosphopantothenate--cysteine ligase